jgi:predicted permease
VSVAPGYFAALSLPLLRGRDFTASDDGQAPRVAVVNETLARRLSPDGAAVGRTFRWGDAPVTVVGIARDVKYGSLDEAPSPFVYFPMAQEWQARQAIVVRQRGADAAGIGAAIQQATLAIDPALPRPQVATLAEETSIVLLPQRVAAIVTAVLGGVGLVLAVVGLYGLVAYTVSRRTREIGVRVALGARRSDVLRLIVGDGMRLTLTGVALGLVLAAFATRLLGALLLGVSPLDVTTFAAMSLAFVAVTLVASWLPARRAAAADPVTVLRSE